VEAPGKFTGCENNHLPAWFDHLQEIKKKLVQKYLSVCKNQLPSEWEPG